MAEVARKSDGDKCAEGDVCCCGKKKSWGKRILISLIVLIAFAIIALGILLISLGPMVTSAVNQLGPQMTGVQVHLGSAKIQALRGNVDLLDLSVGNPAGFSQDHKFFQADHIKLDMNLPAFFKNEIHIQELTIDKPTFVFVYKKDKGWNVQAVMDSLAAQDKADENMAEAKKGKKSNKRLKIDLIRMTNVKVRVNKGVEVTLDFDELTLKNFQDADGNGIPISMVLSKLLKGVVGNIPVLGGVLDVKGKGENAASKIIHKLPNLLKEG